MRERRFESGDAGRVGAEVAIARNTVRRYVRGGTAAERRQRPRARRLDEATWIERRRLFDGAAGGSCPRSPARDDGFP